MKNSEFRLFIRRTINESGHAFDPYYDDQEEPEEFIYEDVFGIALELMAWHGGQWSALYSLASTWNAGELASSQMIENAIWELERTLRDVEKDSGYDEDDEGDLVILIDELKRTISEQ